MSCVTFRFAIIFTFGVFATSTTSTVPAEKNLLKSFLKVLEDRSFFVTVPRSQLNGIDYRLPIATIPLHYDLTLATDIHWDDEFNPKKFEFNAEIEITIRVTQATNEIVLHSKDQIILEAVLRKETGEVVPWINDQPTYENQTEFLRFQTRDQLLSDVIDYKLWIKYSGVLRDRSERGFYKSYYTKQDGTKSWFVGTQFQSVHARHAFPCYDEPGIRANFSVSVIHHNSLHALSNMPIERTWPM